MSDTVAEFAGFYRRHAEAVFRFALYLSHDRSDAEDLTAETFVRVWVAARAVEAATARAYLFTIARNLHLQTVAKRNRHRPLDEELHDPRPDPHDQAATRSDLDAAGDRIGRLAPIDRAALLMRAVDGHSYETIATTLGISISAAKVKVHRARLTLADIR